MELLDELNDIVKTFSLKIYSKWNKEQTKLNQFYRTTMKTIVYKFQQKSEYYDQKRNQIYLENENKTFNSINGIILKLEAITRKTIELYANEFIQNFKSFITNQLHNFLLYFFFSFLEIMNIWKKF